MQLQVLKAEKGAIKERPRCGNRSAAGELFSPIFILSVLVLLLNDFVLKEQFPGFVTGKLSDFAGLFAFAFFWSALCKPSYRPGIYLLTAFLFIVWKSPQGIFIVDLWNDIAPYRIHRVEDYTDLIALSVLPIGYLFQKRTVFNYWPGSFQKVGKYMVIGVSLFGFFATSGTTGNLEIYKIESSKKTVNLAIIELLEIDSSLAAPEYLKASLFLYGSPDSKDPWIQRMNADSVSFNFFDIKTNTVLWARFVGAEENWLHHRCDLGLIAFMGPDGKFQTNDVATNEDKEWAKWFFEQRVINPVNVILKEDE